MSKKALAIIFSALFLIPFLTVCSGGPNELPTEIPFVTPTPFTTLGITSQEATPTSTPIDTSDQFIFEGKEGLGGAIFRVDYAANEWKLENSVLIHRELLNCNLNFTPLAGEVAGPRIEDEIELAGFQWETYYFPSINQKSYILDIERHYFIFFLTLPSSQANRLGSKKCQLAAEDVINTFRYDTSQL